MPHPKNLKILHVDTGREWRGGQRQVLNLCGGLKERGIEQTLAAPMNFPLAQKAEKNGVIVRPFRTWGEFDLLAARSLGGLIDELGATIVHAHDAHAHAMAWWAIQRRPRVTLVVSRRVDFDISRNFFSRRKYLDPRVHYFAISTGVRDVLVRGGVAADRVAIVPSGVDPDRFSHDVPPEKLRREFHVEPDAPVIGTIGSLVDHKDHRTLIDAAPIVLEQFPNARFIIVGEGKLRPALERQIAEKELGDKIALPGHREDVETFLSGFTVFVLSSHLEGLCTSLVDAMLFRLPIAATRTGGVPDLVRHEETGLLVAPRDPGALARAIIQLLEDRPLADRLSQAAQAHAEQNYTVQSLVENTLQAYENALLET